jgi:hypothetical protein
MDDRRFCGDEWWFHLNNIAEKTIIVDVETARGRVYFLKILNVSIWLRKENYD